MGLLSTLVVQGSRTAPSILSQVGRTLAPAAASAAARAALAVPKPGVGAPGTVAPLTVVGNAPVNSTYGYGQSNSMLGRLALEAMGGGEDAPPQQQAALPPSVAPLTVEAAPSTQQTAAPSAVGALAPAVAQGLADPNNTAGELTVEAPKKEPEPTAVAPFPSESTLAQSPQPEFAATPPAGIDPKQLALLTLGAGGLGGLAAGAAAGGGEAAAAAPGVAPGQTALEAGAGAAGGTAVGNEVASDTHTHPEGTQPGAQPGETAGGVAAGTSIEQWIKDHAKDLIAAGLLIPAVTGSQGDNGAGAANAGLEKVAQGNLDLATRLGNISTAGFAGQIGGMGMNSIRRMVTKAQAAIRQRYASMGMSGSTAENEDLQAAAENGVDLQFKIGQEMATAGLQAISGLTGQSATVYAAMLNAATAKNTALGNALANFAAAVVH